MLKLSDIKPGDILVTGRGMLCCKAGREVEVIEAPREYGGGLGVMCSNRFGLHLLAPGAGKDGTVTQFVRKAGKE
jgi:hypothetical protein